MKTIIFVSPSSLYKTSVYTSSSTSLIMNWGWDGSCDSGRYSYNGDWNATSDRNYLYERKMISGFSKR